MALHSVQTPLGPRGYALSDTARPARPTPSLIMGFHGGSGDAQRFALRSGLAESFGAHGHDVAFPQALQHWADGRAAIEGSWAGDHALVDALVRLQGGTTPARLPVAAVGGSNGGMFSLRLACEMTNPPLRAAVAVACAMPVAYAARAPKGPPVPLMLVQATEDRMMPWQGGEVPQVPGISVPGALLGADATVAFWLDRNRCTGQPSVRQAAIGAIPVEIFAWTGPPGGADLWRVVLRGAGHRLLDRSPGAERKGSLEELIARFVIWHLDRDRLSRTEPV